MTFVVDTNVLVVANGRESPQASLECVLACARRLREISTSGGITLDRSELILDEYRRYCLFHGEMQPGDAFFKWVIDHYWDERFCSIVEPTEFPDDQRLANFDAADRKFVCVALAHPDKPPILNAVDSDWHDVVAPLAEHGVTVDCICD